MQLATSSRRKSTRAISESANKWLILSRVRISPNTRSLRPVFEQRLEDISWNICLTDAWKPARGRAVRHFVARQIKSTANSCIALCSSRKAVSFRWRARWNAFRSHERLGSSPVRRSSRRRANFGCPAIRRAQVRANP